MDGHSENLDLAEESLGNPMVAASDQAPVTVENRIADHCNHDNRDLKSHNTPDFSGPKFNTYGENNEEFEKCNSRKRKTRCYNCGCCGHEGKLCKKVTDCFICSKKGHLVVDCPNKNVGLDFSSRLCLKCGRKGHDMFSCANRYDPEDLKDIECYICRKAGHLCCVEDMTKGQTEASCYECGQWGHFGSECPKPNEVPGSFCNKCKVSGHCPKKARSATEKAAARTEKRRTQRARRKLKKTTNSTTIVNNAYHNQPNGWSRPPSVEPHYENGGSNAQTGPLPSHQLGTQLLNYVGPLTRIVQNIYSNAQNRPQIPLNQESQTTVCPLTGSEIRRPPAVQLPIPNVKHQMESRTRVPPLAGSEIRRPPVVQLSIPNVNLQMKSRTMVPPLTGSEIRRSPVVQLPTPNVNHQMESRTRVPPLTGSEIRRPSVVQLPIPNVDHQMESRTRVPPLIGSQIRRPPVVQLPIYNVNHQMEFRSRVPPLSGSEIRRPPVVQLPVPNVNHRRDSRVPLNYTALPSQFSHAIQNNPRQPLIHQTVIAGPPTRIHNPQRYLAPETRVPRPYLGWTFQSTF